MIKIIVVGGGWSGCAAALAATKAGAQAVILERTDMLLGTGLVGGIFRNNGRFTAAEEAMALGGGDLFVAMDANARHRGINFPGHRHASLYDVTAMEPLVKKVLQNYGVELRTQSRVVDVVKSGRVLEAVATADGEEIAGDAFVDATGSAGPMGNCLRYGNGCAMCVLRCPAFGPRVSLTSRTGIKETMGRKADGSLGAMSGSCKINKDTLGPELHERLDRDGVAVIPLPENLIRSGKLLKKACSQYALPEFAANIVLLDTGHAKLMAPFFPLEELRTVPGLEQARFADPYAGGRGNSMRFLGIAPCDETLRVDNMENLFCGGEKAGLMVGHTEAIVTGLLAGHNAVRCAVDMEYLALPRTLAIGDYIRFVHEQMATDEGQRLRYTFSGSVYFQRMQERKLYSTSRSEVRDRVGDAGLLDIYNRCLV